MGPRGSGNWETCGNGEWELSGLAGDSIHGPPVRGSVGWRGRCGEIEDGLVWAGWYRRGTKYLATHEGSAAPRRLWQPMMPRRHFVSWRDGPIRTLRLRVGTQLELTSS